MAFDPIKKGGGAPYSGVLTLISAVVLKAVEVTCAATFKSDLADAFPWLETPEEETDFQDGGLLSRHRRSTNETDSGSKSVWEEIEDFYSDKNNMAMYCVLPIMILIYGGCSAIYCVHKCRMYCRHKKHKKLKEDDLTPLDQDKNDLSKEDTAITVVGGDMEQGQGRAVSQMSQAWAELGQGPTWSGETEARPLAGTPSPLPWQTQSREDTEMSRASYLPDKLRNDDLGVVGASAAMAPAYEANRNRADFMEPKRTQDEKMSQVLCEATVTSSSTDPDLEERQQQQQQQPPRKPPVVVKPAPEIQQPYEASRGAANLNDYASSTSTLKATDYSRFSDSKPIEIIPLSADPNLRVWDPLHNRPFGEPGARKKPKISPLVEPQPGTSRGGASSGRESAYAMKEEMLARYEALSTYQMARRAAQILQTNAVEKSPFQRRAGNKKKHVFIAE